MSGDVLETTGQHGPPATLGDLEQEGVGLFAWCVPCGRGRTLDLAPVLARLGAEFPVPALREKLRCTECGSRDVTVRPDWRKIGVIARHS